MAKVKTKTKGKSSSGAAGTKVRKERQEVVRHEIIELDKQIEDGFLNLAKLLSEAFHQEFHAKAWGYQTFEDFCNAELETKYRKAMYLIKVYDKVKFLDLPKERVEKLGWTKMKEIASVIDEDNAKEWLDKAEKMTSRELEEAVSTVRKHRTSRGNVPAIVTMTFKMSEVVANVITEALGEAKKLCEADDDPIALEMICQDWLMDKAEKPVTRSLADHIAYLEKVYGVLIEYKVTKPGGSQKEKAEEVLDKADGKDARDDNDEVGVEADPDGDNDSLDIDELLGIGD